MQINEKGRKMKVIEATRPMENQYKEENHKKRVAAYARVSTETDEQENSFENQREYFMWRINSNPNYIFAGLYSDEGITGTSTKNRQGFQQMMRDALSGKIDLILVKSISRFGRNTLDTLNSCRALKKADIDVYFERENIHILDQAGELLLTIFSSLAQEESRSISENVKLGIRSAYSRGVYKIKYTKYVGYTRTENGTLEVNSDAWLVRYLYLLFYEGNSFRAIAQILNAEGIIRPHIGPWTKESVKGIFMNEVYCGDVLLQKTFIKDYLDHKTVVNKGYLPKYYVYDDHEPLVSRELFYYTQRQYKNRVDWCMRLSRNAPVESLCNMLVCGNCNRYFGLRTGHSNDKYRFDFYRCHSFYKNTGCTSTTIRKEKLFDLFVDVLDEMNGRSYLKIFDLLLNEISPQKTEVKMKRRARKIVEFRQALDVAPAVAVDYIESVTKKLERQLKGYENLEKEKAYRESLTARIEEVRKSKQFKRSFDAKAYTVLLDRVVVNNNALTFVFRDGRAFERTYRQMHQKVEKEM